MALAADRYSFFKENLNFRTKNKYKLIKLLFTKIVWRFASWTGLDRLRWEKVAEIWRRFLVKSGWCWAFVETWIEERISGVTADKVVPVSRIVIVVITSGVCGARIPAATAGRIAIIVSGGRSRPVLTVTGRRRIVRRKRSKWRKKRTEASVSTSVVMESWRWRARRRSGADCDRVVGCSTAAVCVMVDVVLLLLELARWFTLTPLGTSVLEPNLNAGLAQLQAQCKFFTSKDIRIGCSFKSSL